MPTVIMDVSRRCTLWPSAGLRVLADGFTVQHTAPSSLRPPTAFLGSPLAHVGAYFEVRVLHLPTAKGAIKVLLRAEPGCPAPCTACWALGMTVPWAAGLCWQVGLYDPDVTANKSRACPTVDDMVVRCVLFLSVCIRTPVHARPAADKANVSSLRPRSLSSDTGFLTIKHRDGTKRSPASTFGAGDTIGTPTAQRRAARCLSYI